MDRQRGGPSHSDIAQAEAGRETERNRHCVEPLKGQDSRFERARRGAASNSPHHVDDPAVAVSSIPSYPQSKYFPHRGFSAAKAVLTLSEARNVRRTFIALLAAILWLPILSWPQANAQGESAESRLVRAANPIPGKYIVVLDDSLTIDELPTVEDELQRAHGGSVGHRFSAALRGFAVDGLTEVQAEALSRHPAVSFVEEDSQTFLQDTQPNPVNWGIDRIDQRDLPRDSSYTYAQRGLGVRAYVVDTGILQSHSEFTGRIGAVIDFVDDDQDGDPNDLQNDDSVPGQLDAIDRDGHGTHVAGILGGTQYGVAKGVQITALRVFPVGRQGLTSDAIAALDWIAANRVLPAVANLSFSAEVVPANNSELKALEKAVRQCQSAGVVMITAAGNEDRDVSNFSPARTAEILTVGAIRDLTDERWEEPVIPGQPVRNGSAYGTLIDLFAPGKDVPSASILGSAPAIVTGTSQAAPHVSAAVAQYLERNAAVVACPCSAAAAIVGNATPNKISNPGTGSPNRLLYAPPEGWSPLQANSLNAASTGAITVEAWVKLTANNVSQVFVARYGAAPPAGTTDGGYELRLTNNGKVRFSTIGNNATSIKEMVNGATTLSTGVWYHVVGEYGSFAGANQLRVYVNGILDGSKSISYPPQTGTAGLRIASSSSGTERFTGLIDEVRVTARVLYASNFVPARQLTGLVDVRGLWRFDGATVNDCGSINNGNNTGHTFSTDVP